MKPRFPVPVSWRALDPKVIEKIRADTTVLHLQAEVPQTHRVVPVADRRHTTPKLYRIEVLNHWNNRWHTWEEIRPCRLGNLLVGSWCLIEIPVRHRFQAVWQDAKGCHVTWGTRSDRVLLCRDGSYRDSDSPPFYGEVTCRECLKVKTVWLPFLVEYYEHPRVIEKTRRKVQNRARIRAKYPTVFDRLLSDFFDDD